LNTLFLEEKTSAFFAFAIPLAINKTGAAIEITIQYHFRTFFFCKNAGDHNSRIPNEFKVPVVLRQASLKLQNISALFCGLILMMMELISLSVPKYPFQIPHTVSVLGSEVFMNDENKVARMITKNFKSKRIKLLILYKSKDWIQSSK